jgi:hypothetical protein
VSPVKYELVSYIPEDDILHSHHRENLKSYIALTGWVFISQKTTFFIVTAVETSNLTDLAADDNAIHVTDYGDL